MFIGEENKVQRSTENNLKNNLEIIAAQCEQYDYAYTLLIIRPHRSTTFGRAHWRNLASVCCSDAALCQITLTTCYIYLLNVPSNFELTFCIESYLIKISALLRIFETQNSDPCN